MLTRTQIVGSNFEEKPEMGVEFGAILPFWGPFEKNLKFRILLQENSNFGDQFLRFRSKPTEIFYAEA